MSSVFYATWALSSLLSAIVAYRILRFNLAHRYRAMLAFCVTIAASFTLAIIPPRLYIASYKYVGIISAAIEIVAVIECIVRITEHFPSFERTRNTLLAIAVLSASLVSAYLYRPDGASHLNNALSLVISIHGELLSSTLVVLAVYYALVPKVRAIPIRHSVKAYACGLILHFIGETANDYILQSHTDMTARWLSQIMMLVMSCLGTGCWIWLTPSSDVGTDRWVIGEDDLERWKRVSRPRS